MAQTETFEAKDFLGTPGQVNDFKLPTFNSNLGTLEGVDISLQFFLCTSITVDNSTNAPIGYTGLNLTLPITADLPGGLDSVTSVPGQASNGTAQPGSKSYYEYRIPTFVSETVNSTDFADWKGLPNQLLTFVITPGNPTIQGVANAPGVTFSGDSTEWAQLSVTYSYLTTAAAPEPSGRLLSFLAGAAMLVGIGWRMRMRDQAA